MKKQNRSRSLDRKPYSYWLRVNFDPKQRDEVKEWLSENISGQYLLFNYHVQFKDNRDRVLWYLRWG